MAKEDIMAVSNMGSAPAEDELASMEEKAKGVADEMDAEYEDDMEMVAPSGSYDARSLNALVDALNKVIPLFDKTLPLLQPYDGDVKGKLPTELVKAVSMIYKAATDAGFPDLAPSIDILTDSRSLQMAAGKIILLAKNREFGQFLKSAPQGPTVAIEVKPAVTPAPATSAPSGAEMDALMASRM